jgi:hypothetical protein
MGRNDTDPSSSWADRIQKFPGRIVECCIGVRSRNSGRNKLARPELCSGEGRGLGHGDNGGASLPTRCPERSAVPRTPELERVRKGEGAEVGADSVVILDQLVGLGQRATHVNRAEWPDIRLKSR